MIFDELAARHRESGATATMLHLSPRPALPPLPPLPDPTVERTRPLPRVLTAPSIQDRSIGRLTAGQIQAGVITTTTVRPYGRHARRDGA